MKSKITNQDRITRLLMKICQGNMHAVIRTQKNINLGIRAVFHMIEAVDKPKLIYFSSISKVGKSRLKKGEPIRVEVIGMPSRIMFVSVIHDINDSGVSIFQPNALVSIERRQNSRYNVSPQKMAYLNLGLYQPAEEDVTAHPSFPLYNDLNSWFPVVDISLGGLCFQTRFPSIIKFVEKETPDKNASLILPMTPPIETEVHFRWQKKIKNRIVEDENERFQFDYRLGIQFGEMNKETQSSIKLFLRQLAMADAV